MDLPDGVAPLLDRFVTDLAPLEVVLAVYAGGSLATGDFRAASSDLDLAAVVSEPLDDVRRRELESLHTRLMHEEPRAAKLHCVYVPTTELADLGAEHWTWAHGELYRREFSGIARAELLRGGITLCGPPPVDLIPDVGPAALHQAVRDELSGYWSGAVRKPHVWLEDVYVDLGLLILARAEATLTEDRLITKTEALTRLDRFGVEPDLVRQIERRRNGETVLPQSARLQRARHVRRLVKSGIRRLLED